MDTDGTDRRSPKHLAQTVCQCSLSMLGGVKRDRGIVQADVEQATDGTDRDHIRTPRFFQCREEGLRKQKRTTDRRINHRHDFCSFIRGFAAAEPGGSVIDQNVDSWKTGADLFYSERNARGIGEVQCKSL